MIKNSKILFVLFIFIALQTHIVHASSGSSCDASYPQEDEHIILALQKEIARLTQAVARHKAQATKARKRAQKYKKRNATNKRTIVTLSAEIEMLKLQVDDNNELNTYHENRIMGQAREIDILHHQVHIIKESNDQLMQKILELKGPKPVACIRVPTPDVSSPGV